MAGYAAEVIGGRAAVEYLEYADVPLTDMPAAISGAGGKAANANVRRRLVDLLEYAQASIVYRDDEGFVLPASAWETGVYVIPERDKTRIALQAEDLLTALS